MTHLSAPPPSAPPSATPPSDPPLILHATASFVFIHKPPGVLSVPGRAPGQQHSVAVLVQKTLGLERPPWVCHRLDRDTSGVMVLALTEASHRAASVAFSQHQVRKTYAALVAGRFAEALLVDAPLGPDPEAPEGARQRQGVGASGKAARTVLAPLWTSDALSLVAARPSTGRTHQVRAHLAHVGHPLLGDATYGGPPAARTMLHALALSFFALGATHEALAPWPPDLLAALLAAGGTAPPPPDVDAGLTRVVRGPSVDARPPRRST